MSTENHKSKNQHFEFLFQYIPIIALAICIFIHFFYPPFSTKLAVWPFIVSLFFIGLPHGAIDWELSCQINSAKSWIQKLNRFSGYLAILAAVIGMMFVFPLVTVISFALLSIWHFGSADIKDLRARNHKPLPQVFWIGSAFIRGTLVLGLPFFFFPIDSKTIVQQLCTLLQTQPDLLLNSYVSKLGLMVLYVVIWLQVGVFIFLVYTRNWELFFYSGIETATIFLTFMLLHPLFAVGMYFLCWHSWRQMGKLMVFLNGNSSFPSGIDIFKGIFQIHVKSLILLIPTIAVYIFLLILLVGSWDPYKGAILTLVIFAAVTLPHHLLMEKIFSGNNKSRDLSESFPFSKIPRGYTPTKLLRVKSK